jgi:hypothetical protein
MHIRCWSVHLSQGWTAAKTSGPTGDAAPSRDLVHNPSALPVTIGTPGIGTLTTAGGVVVPDDAGVIAHRMMS